MCARSHLRLGMWRKMPPSAEATAMSHGSSALKYLGEEYSGFWAAAEKVAGFVALCLLTLLLISIEIQFGIKPPSPIHEECLFD